MSKRKVTENFEKAGFSNEQYRRIDDTINIENFSSQNTQWKQDPSTNDFRTTSLRVLRVVDGIDATTAGSTRLLQIRPGEHIVVTQVITVCTDFTVGSKSINAVINFGQNASTYDDYINSATYSFTAANQLILDTADGIAPLLIANDDFRFRVETASNATEETYSVTLVGYNLTR